MNRTDDEIAHDAHTSWALGQLAERMEELTEVDWWKALWCWAPRWGTTALDEEFSGWWELQLRVHFPGSPPFYAEVQRLLAAGESVAELAWRRKVGPSEKLPLYGPVVWNQLTALRWRAAIAIMWRTRLSEVRTDQLLRVARAAGISFDDLL